MAVKYNQTYEEFVVSQVSDAGFIRTLSIVFGAITVGFIAMIVIARMIAY